MNQVEGVLLEGVDYVGKTSVARCLTQRLANAGVPHGTGTCYLRRTPVIEFLERQAKLHQDMNVRDYFYTAALLSDLMAPEPPAGFQVQDRHWLTQLGRNTFFHDGEEIFPSRHLIRAHRPFTHNVLLTSDQTTKVERAANRPPKSPRDEYLRTHPGVHQRYETYLRTLLPEDENWLVLDTTGRTVDELVGEVLSFCGLAQTAGRV